METALLATKIRRPRLTSDLVARPRLLARLQQQPERGLTLVCAPAGYGKTTLLCEWLTQVEGERRLQDSTATGGKHSAFSRAAKVAWISLDKNDNTLNLFVRYIVASLQVHVPGSFGEVLSLLAARRHVSVHVLVTALVNQLDELGQRVILVLDDYHALNQNTLHECLSLLIQNLPPTVHLVLATRIDPVLPLARIHAQGNCVELRAADLRFTRQEIEAFVQQTTRADVDSTAMDVLAQRSEGWVAGLRLAALSLGGQNDLATLSPSLSGRESVLTAYLVDQVLSQQTQQVQAFLLRSSLLDRFCLPLCELLLEATAGQTTVLLDEVKRANLFITPLDDEDIWFRYHQIFQDVLRRRLAAQLGKPHVARLHHQASQWFEAHGLLEEALHHALQADDADSAGRLIERHAYAYLNGEDWHTVERWLDQLPDRLFQERLLLATIRAWLWFEQWKLEAVVPLLNQIEGRLERGNPDLEPVTEQLVTAYLATLRSHYAYWAADPQAGLTYAQRALELAPANHRFLRGTACLYYALSLQALGQAARADAVLNEILEHDGYRPDFFTGRLYVGKLASHQAENELHQAVRASEYLLGLAASTGLMENAVWAHNMMGRVYYDWNQLEQARLQYSRSVELHQIANARAALNAHFGLALTYQALGRAELAEEVVARANALALGTHSPTQLLVCAAFEARLALLQGKVEQAAQRAGLIPLSFTPNMLLMIEIPELTKLQILIAEGTPASLAAAEQWQSLLQDFCAHKHIKYSMTTVLALKAMLCAAQGRDAAARHALHAAVESARRTQRLRTFVDLGEPMCVLLRQLAAEVPDDPYLRQILAAFELREPDKSNREYRDATATRYRSALPLDPLTRREHEVLALLRTHLTAKQIARHLSISPLTVEKHTVHIYSKLGVSNRNDAVVTAIEIGVLQPLE